MEKFKIYDETSKKYCVEISLAIMGGKGYQRDIFTKKQAERYIQSMNDIRKQMNKNPHKYILERN